MIEMVSLAESRLRQGRPDRVPGAAACRRRPRRPPRSRRSFAAPARHARARAPSRRASSPTFRTAPEILGYVNGAELAVLQPARRGDAGPHHPHQEHAAGGAAAGGRQARRVRRRRARGGRQVRRRLRCLFRPRERGRRQHQNQARRQPARGARAGRRPVRLRAHGQGCLDRRRSRREHGQRGHRCRRPSAATSRCPRAICSRSNIGASSRPS